MNKQVIVIAIVIILFVSAVVGASFLLAGKGQQQPQDHTTHDESTFNSWIGKEAPNFTIDSFQGGKVSLDQLRGKKVLLFFTEGVMCYPACWNQIAAFGKDSAFNNEDTTTLIITVETKNSWEKAVKKMPELAASTVLLDSMASISQEYGVLFLPSSMHKGQYPGHTYLILDKNGIVRYVLDDPQMAVRNDELKTELEKLN